MAARVADALPGWLGESTIYAVAVCLAPVVASLAREQAAEAEARGYERGRRDFQFAPEGDNHHNAAMCPYCSPEVTR
jgi:hypothetical protein